jgi:DNA-binding SARP family transcriptional activator
MHVMIETKRSPDIIAAEAWDLRSRDSARALELATQVIEKGRRSKRRSPAAWGMLTIAFIDMLRARYDDAWKGTEDALAIFGSAGDRRGEAAALFLQGVVCRWRGEGEKGIDLYDRSLAIARAIDDGAIEAAALNGLGNLVRTGGDYQKGLEYFIASRDAAIRAGAREAEANATFGIGTTYVELGDDRSALPWLHDAAAIAREQSNNRLLASIDGVIALVHGHSGDIATALAYKLELLKSMEALDDPLGVVIVLIDIGDNYIELGEYDCALDSYLRALDLCRSHSLLADEAIALIRIGRLYERFEENPIVIDYYLRSLAIARTVGDNFSEVYALFYLGRFYRSCGEEPKALAYFFKCLRMQQRSRQRPGEGSALQAIGATYGMLGDFETARGYLLQSRAIARETEDTDALIRALVASGRVEIDAGKPEDARPYLDEAIETARAVGHLDLTRFVLAELTEGARALGDIERERMFQRQLQSINETIFNAGTRRRVATLIDRFRGDHVRREGEALGLERDDLDRLDEAVERWKGRGNRRGADRLRPPSEGRDPDALLIRSSRAPIDARIRIETFGAFRVALEGRELRKGSWYRKRARDLFKLLLVNHRSAVSVDQIEECLWGEAGERNLESLVMNAISHIRNALGIGSEPGASGGSLIRVEDSYMLDLGDDVSIDFVRFRDLIVAARSSETVAARKREYAAAIELYRGDFLPEDLSAEWSDFQRQILKDAWFEAMEYLAREHLRDNELERAIDLARRILERDDTSESAWHVLLVSLTQRGRLSEARRALDQCTERFRRDLGEDPPERLREIVERRGGEGARG